MQKFYRAIRIARYFNRTRFHSYLNPSRLNGPLIMEFFPSLNIFYEKQPNKTLDRVEYSQISSIDIKPPASTNNLEIYVYFQRKRQIALSFRCEDRKTAECTLEIISLMCRFSYQSNFYQSLCQLQNSVVKVIMQNPAFDYILKTTAVKFNQSFLQYRPLYHIYQRYKTQMQQLADIKFKQFSPLAKASQTFIQQDLWAQKTQQITSNSRQRLVGYTNSSNLIVYQGQKNTKQRTDIDRQLKNVHYFYNYYHLRGKNRRITTNLKPPMRASLTGIDHSQNYFQGNWPYINKQADLKNIPAYITQLAQQGQVSKMMASWMAGGDKKWIKKKNIKEKFHFQNELVKNITGDMTQKAYKIIVPKISKEKILLELQKPFQPSSNNVGNKISLLEELTQFECLRLATQLRQSDQASQMMHIKNAVVLARYLYQTESGKVKTSSKVFQKIMEQLYVIKGKLTSQQYINFINKTLHNSHKYMNRGFFDSRKQSLIAETQIIED